MKTVRLLIIVMLIKMIIKEKDNLQLKTIIACINLPHTKCITLVSDVFHRGKINCLAMFESLQSCKSNGVFISMR